MSQTEAAISGIFSNIQGEGRQILTRQEVTSLTYAPLPLSSLKQEKVASLQNYLNDVVAHSNYINGIYIYFHNLECSASTEGFLTKDSFIREMRNRLSADYNTMMQWMDDKKEFQVKMISNDDEDFASAQKIAVIMTYTSYRNHPDVTCIFLVNIDTLLTLLKNYNYVHTKENQNVWIVSPNDKMVICEKHTEELAEKVKLAFNEDTQTYQTNFKDKETSVTTVYSKITGWTLVSIFSMFQYTEQLRQVQYLYLIFIALCICAGIITSLYFSRKNYIPVKRLTQLLGEKSSLPSGVGEFAFLEDSLQSLIKKKQDYEEKIDIQKSKLRKASLLKILRGTIHSDQAFYDICNDYEIHFSTHQFSVIGILIHDYSKLISKMGYVNDEESMEMISFIVESTLNGFMQESFDVYMCDSDDNLYCVVSPKKTTNYDNFKETFDDAAQLCRQVEKDIREKYGIEMAFYISDFYGGHKSKMECIASAHQETLWGLEQIEGFHFSETVIGRNDIINAIRIGGSTLETPSNSIRHAQLNNLVFSGNIEEADKLYLSLLDEGIVQINKTFSNIKLHSISLLDYFVINMEPKQIESCSKELEKILLGLMKARTIDEIKIVMHKGFLCIHQSFKQANDTETSTQLGFKITKYIDENFRNPNLSVASIADYFEISESYLLRVFKKVHGSGVLDYIHQRRIDEAKVILKNTTDTISEIAEKVGYTNSLALMRAFKRLEGITPTVYRNL